MLVPVDGETPPVSHVFGYGSLIWRPGFEHEGAEPALLRGAHRCLCVYSHRYRGTSERPGLVFGLANGGSCHGMAFRIKPEDWSVVRAYLWDRELISGVYRPSIRRIELASGQTVEALAFLVDPDHDQYAGQLDIDAQVRFIRQGHGSAGPNTDYVLNTAQHLVEMGIRDTQLEQVCAALEN